MSCAIDEGTYITENVETERYLFQDGEKIKDNQGDEGGWLASSGFQAPPVLGADANYYNQAYWKIIPQGDDRYFVENVETNRYLFQDGEKIKGNRGDEGGWLASSGFQAPPVLGADANYYNQAYWKIIPQGDDRYFVENVETTRYLFQDGEKIKGNRGDEGGWLASSGFQAPPVLGADANYYNQAYWKIIPQGDARYFVENVETKRYLFQDGEKIKGNRGDEGGWKASSGFQAPSVLGADANYYNRAYWKIIPQDDGKYFFENTETQRYLFQNGEKIKGKRGDEGGWLSSSGFQAPSALGADANYYNRAYWKLQKQ